MSAILSSEEIQSLTGYRQPAAQVAELMRQGFYRARRAPSDGSVILERAHYEAVCSGALKPMNEPRVRPPRLRTT